MPLQLSFSLIVGKYVSVCAFQGCKGRKIRIKDKLRSFFYNIQGSDQNHPISILIKKKNYETRSVTRSSKNQLTILHLQKVADQVLHEAILLCHVSLKVHHLGEHVLIIVFQVANMCRHVVLRLNETLYLCLQGFDSYRRR